MNDTDKHLRDLWVSVVEAADKASTALVTYSSGTPPATEESSYASIHIVHKSHKLRNTILVLLIILIVIVLSLMLGTNK